MARSFSNANAGLYLCRPCRDAGDRAYGNKRVRVEGPVAVEYGVKDGGMVALCESHRMAYDAARGIDRYGSTSACVIAATEDTGDLMRATYDLERMAREAWATITDDEYARIVRVSNSTTVGITAEGALDILLDEFVAGIAREAVRRECEIAMIEPSVRAQILRLGSMHVRSNSPRLASIDADGMEWVTDEMTITDIPDGFRPDVLACMDRADVATLYAYANRDECDGRAPTRSDAAAWSAGTMVPVSGASDHVREAAARYVLTRAMVDTIG